MRKGCPKEFRSAISGGDLGNLIGLGARLKNRDIYSGINIPNLESKDMKICHADTMRRFR